MIIENKVSIQMDDGKNRGGKKKKRNLISPSIISNN